MVNVKAPKITLCRFKLEIGQSCSIIRRAADYSSLITQHHPQHTTDFVDMYETGWSHIGAF